MDSIASYAESLILEDLEGVIEGKKSTFCSPGISAEPDMPDISQIDLNTTHIQALLEGKNISSKIVPIGESLTTEKDSTEMYPNTYSKPEELADPISILVEQLSYLVEKAESLVSRLDEVTTCGCGGTNQKFNLMQSEPFAAPPAPKVMKKVRKLRKYRR